MADSFKKFIDIFIHSVKEIVNEQDMHKGLNISKSLSNHLFGLNYSVTIKSKINPTDHFFSKLFLGFKEIAESYFSLLDFEKYIGRSPYSKTEIPKARHLRYHITNYLNEVYRLQKRLKTYATIISRSYKKDPHFTIINQQTDSLITFIESSLDSIVNLKETRVRQNRYSDDNLDRLSSLELLATYDDGQLKPVRQLYAKEYRRIRKNWKEWMHNNNKLIKKLLNEYLNVIYKIVVDKNANINYPQNIGI
jgi:hypothetical protein